MKFADQIRARRSLFAESNEQAVIRGLRREVVGELDFDDPDRPRLNSRPIVERAWWGFRRWLKGKLPIVGNLKLGLSAHLGPKVGTVPNSSRVTIFQKSDFQLGQVDPIEEFQLLELFS